MRGVHFINLLHHIWSAIDRAIDVRAIIRRAMVTCLRGGAENDGHESDGLSKCPGMNLTDMKKEDEFWQIGMAKHEVAWHKIDGRKIDGRVNARHVLSGWIGLD